jgi:Zn-dependent peptidase ImmA (M78 family)
MLDAVKKTFEILASNGITEEVLYKNAEGKDKFKIPFDKILETLKINVCFEENLKDVNNKTISGISDYEGKIIKINKSDCAERKRFTLGHELYHILNKQSRNRNNNGENDIEEVYANAFSAEFLMPKNILKKKFIEEFNKSVWMTADYFQVSWEAMGYRLINCGLSR